MNFWIPTIGNNSADRVKSGWPKSTRPFLRASFHFLYKACPVSQISQSSSQAPLTLFEVSRRDKRDLRYPFVLCPSPRMQDNVYSLRHELERLIPIVLFLTISILPWRSSVSQDDATYAAQAISSAGSDFI